MNANKNELKKKKRNRINSKRDNENSGKIKFRLTRF